MTARKISPKVRLEQCSYRLTKGKLRVNITLANYGSKPIFAMRGVRRIEFDKKNGTLTLWFSDKGRDTGEIDPVRKEYTVPNVVVIDPGEKKTISAELSERLTRLIPHEDGSFEFEVLDLSRAKTVIVKMTVSYTPFYFNPKEPSIIKQLIDWGVVIETTAEKAKKTPQRMD
ncbi:MAG: hypothetical protein ACFFCW_07210 [Candidatus Hodarchaeota archaeon]